MSPTPLKRKTIKIRLKGKNLRFKARKPRKSGEITKLKKKLWILCREITRKRYGNTCYTCGKTGLEGGNWQTGHYITSSACSVELRYDLQNLRPQCYHCNINLSGNWTAFYRKVESEDPGKTQFLLMRNDVTRGTVYPKEWFESKISEYTALLSQE